MNPLLPRYIFSPYFIMDILQTLGEKISSMFVPSSDVVMEDVVQPADSTLVQAQKNKQC